MVAEMALKKKTGGLAGIVAGETKISAAGGAHTLEYRGYSIYDLAEHSEFEEVAYLLIHGELPNVTQLAQCFACVGKHPIDDFAEGAAMTVEQRLKLLRRARQRRVLAEETLAECALRQ